MDQDGSVRSRSSTINLHADGSSHGGRRFFDVEDGRGQHSPTSNEPAAAGNTANRQHTSANAHHGAVWVIEDSSGKHGNGSTHSGRSKQQRGSMQRSGSGSGTGTGSSASGGSSSGRRGLDKAAEQGLANAKVLIEDPNELEMFDWGAYWGSLPKKLKGGLDTRLPIPTWRNVFWGWLGAFLGILAVSALNQWVTPDIDIALIVGSFGASAVLIFGVIESKMAQPRNFMGGQFLSGLVGITTRVVIHQAWIAGPVGMSLALVVMMVTSTTHPPGGATALIAATLTDLPKWHGYAYLVTVGLGSLVMQVIALVVNNIDPQRRYPTFWW
ncbi:hypothetical protein D9Q98_006616 [Chlorella vulgaris]|uniref:HPP transmembrane region domain-containing protein n=1 Tax=Chlorella vulgaris TaxID=3077 RepID=A0A9D4TKN2_CHLVU|nr:hypothetical protein D9Q98_006616 [Chlorella vulgaris]